MPVRVSVIVPVLDQANLMHIALASFVGKSSYQIIVVDNGSSIETQVEISNYGSQIQVIRNEVNLGYAQACNQGSEIALGEYLLFLNSDAEVSHEACEHLVEKLELDSSIGAVSPVLLYPNGSIDSVGSFLTWYGILYHPFRKQDLNLKLSGDFDVHTLKGAVMLWRTALFRSLGRFKEEFFAYSEETDLCFRALSSGHRIVTVLGVAAVHHEGSTSKRIFNADDYFYLSCRNQIATLVSAFSGYKKWTLLIGLVVAHLVELVRCTLINPRRVDFRRRISAIGDGFRLAKRHQTSAPFAANAVSPIFVSPFRMLAGRFVSLRFLDRYGSLKK